MGKLRAMVQDWPQGTVATSSWFERQGISRQLRQKYLESGWLKALGYGAFVKLSDQPSWLGGYYALQQELELHVGGISSLEILGQAHFLPTGANRRLYFYSHSKMPELHLPKWFAKTFAQNSIQKVNFRIFKSKCGLQEHNTENFKVTISGAERALFEVLALVPKYISFEYAALLFQGQNLLRAELVQELLQECKLEKVKRLFLYLAREQQLACFKHIDLRKANLSGRKISIGPGEVYDPQFKLSVPNLAFDEDVEV
jgi:hypothetical protein